MMSQIGVMGSDALRAVQRGDEPTDEQLADALEFPVSLINREDAVVAIDAYNEFQKAVLDGETTRKNREWRIFMCARRSAHERMLRFTNAI